MPGAFPSLARGFASYDSDDGNTYLIATSADNISAGGLTPTPPGGFPSLPRGWKVRHVYGVNSTGGRTKLPIGNTGNPLYTAGGSFTKDGLVWIVEGKIGEKRTARA